MSKPIKTPGVYIKELDAFGNAVAPVATAIPVFIGHTEQITCNGKDIRNRPIKINSLAEFRSIFELSDAAARPITSFTIQKADTHTGASHFSSNGTEYTLYPNNTIYSLHSALRFFYANGGGTCYILSIGDCATELKLDAFTNAITLLEKEIEPTMLVIPDAVALTSEKNTDTLAERFSQVYALQTAMIHHCGTIKNRVAIIDVPGGYNEPITDPMASVIAFRNGMTPSNPTFNSYAVAYYPWLHTTVYNTTDISYKNISTASYPTLFEILNTELKQMTSCVDEHGNLKLTIVKMLSVFTDSPAPEAPNMTTVDTTLKNISALYPLLLENIGKQLNLMPPSAAMAGIYSLVDNNEGVWKAPANVGLQNVIVPAVKIDHAMQEDLNVPLDGKSICAIRSFPGIGNLVWGARTLDGNSNDWRYINVRRTLIFLEQSLKEAAMAYIFAPNDASTWTAAQSMMNAFLTDIWKQGGLQGAKPSDAFQVSIGLGTTMTNDDIRLGIMRVSVKVAISHPGEFIVITFQQEMQKA